MKLYELKIEAPWEPGAAMYSRRWEYFTASGAAVARVTSIKKSLNGAGLVAALNAVTMRTSLVAADWIKLLQSDAPGTYCELTPQDLVTSRKVLRTWEVLAKPGEE